MPSFPDGRHSGTVVPLDRANVDTDAIFPKQYGRSTARSGYGPVLFDSWPLLGQDIDWIGATLAQRERIAAFEAARLARQPWLDKMLEPGSPP